MKSEIGMLGMVVWLVLASCATPGDPASTPHPTSVATEPAVEAAGDPAPPTDPHLPEPSLPALSGASDPEDRRLPYPAGPSPEAPSTEQDARSELNVPGAGDGPADGTEVDALQRVSESDIPEDILLSPAPEAPVAVASEAAPEALPLPSVHGDGTPAGITPGVRGDNERSSERSERRVRPETPTTVLPRITSQQEKPAPTETFGDAGPEREAPPATLNPRVRSVESTESDRTVTEGERIEVRLPGRSWLFLGSDAPVDFLGRTVSDEPSETVFSFRVIGVSTLRFASQDVVSGESSLHQESITISSSSVEAIQRGDVVRSQSDASPSGQAAPATVERRSAPTRGELLEYLQSEMTPFDSVMHNGLIESVRHDDPDGDSANALSEVSTDSWIAYTERIAANGEVSATEQLLAALAESLRFGNDEVIFRLAKLYETDSEVRDIQRARDMYRIIESEYPFSRFYREAGERIRFLNRHFFFIR